MGGEQSNPGSGNDDEPDDLQNERESQRRGTGKCLLAHVVDGRDRSDHQPGETEDADRSAPAWFHPMTCQFVDKACRLVGCLVTLAR